MHREIAERQCGTLLMKVWKSNKYTDKLTVRVIDRDGGAIGSAISQGLVSRLVSPLTFPFQVASCDSILPPPLPSHMWRSCPNGQLAQTNLRYFTSSPSSFPTDAEVAHDVVQEGTWAAIVISPGATSDLQEARAIGNSSYRGGSAIHVYYAQARQENAVGTYLLPYMQGALTGITSQISAQSVAQ